MSTIVVGNFDVASPYWGTVENLKRVFATTYTNNFGMTQWKELSADVSVQLRFIDGKPHATIFTGSGVFLSVMDIHGQTGSYPNAHQPPFQISNSRVVYKSSTSKQTKSGIYSGGNQRREGLWATHPQPAKYSSYSEGGSWRGKVNGKERAVSWSYSDSEGWWKSTDYLEAAPKEYVVYIGGHWGELPMFNAINDSFDPSKWRGMSIAGICLIDPKRVNSTHKYVIQVLYKNNYVYRIPIICTYGVTLGDDDKLTFTGISMLWLYDLNPDNLQNYYLVLTNFSSDGLHFFTSSTLGRLAGNMGDNNLVRIKPDTSSYQLISIPITEPLLDEMYYPNNAQQMVHRWRLLGSLIKSDYDRFVLYYHIDDREHVNGYGCGPVRFFCFEIKIDGSYRKVSDLVGDPSETLSPFDKNQLLFASAKLGIYQYYRGYPLEAGMNHYESNLITIIQGTQYTDRITISDIWTEFLSGLTGHLPVIEYPNWANSPYTNNLLILGTFEPYVKAPTFVIDFVIGKDTNGDEKVDIIKTTKLTADADKIDAVYPADFNGAAVVSPISLMHLPY